MLLTVLRYLLKYIVFATIIYLLLAYIPKNPIDLPNQTFIFVVAIGSFVILDLIINYNILYNYCSKYLLNKPSLNGSCGCAIEKFDTNPTPTIPVIPNIPTPTIPTVTPTIPTPVIPTPVIPTPVVPITPKTETNEMKYTELPPEMHQPLGTYDSTFTNDFDHGYTYLNTSKWSVPMRKPPVCIQEKECPVCPVFTTGTHMELKDFPMSINPAEKINVNYVKDVINKSQ